RNGRPVDVADGAGGIHVDRQRLIRTSDDCRNVSARGKTVAHRRARCNIRGAGPFDNHRTIIRIAMNKKEARTRIAALLSAGA
ncbi:hypothetical protein SB763_34815, partial [Burkholderia sp. SIMBA_042]